MSIPDNLGLESSQIDVEQGDCENSQSTCADELGPFRPRLTESKLIEYLDIECVEIGRASCRERV